MAVRIPCGYLFDMSGPKRKPKPNPTPKRKPATTPVNKAIDPAPENKAFMNEGVALPAPDHPTAPKYWKYEAGGELAPAMERLIRREPLTDRDIVLIRDYFRQWVRSPVWDRNPHAGVHGATAALARLRADVDNLQSYRDIEAWESLAVDWGIDPL